MNRLSRGMRRALTIAAALAHKPDLLFLDELTTGLDVVSARNLRQMIAALRDEGMTVFLTTHYLEEAERLCDRIAMMVRGCIVALDTVAELRSQTNGFTGIELVLEGHNGATVPEIRRLSGDSVESLIVQGMADAQAEGRRVIALNTVQPSLEDVFVELTGLDVDAMRIEKNGKGK